MTAVDLKFGLASFDMFRYGTYNEFICFKKEFYHGKT